MSSSNPSSPTGVIGDRRRKPLWFRRIYGWWMSVKKVAFQLFGGLLLIASFGALQQGAFFDRFERMVLDRMFRVRPPLHSLAPLVFIDIDEDSARNLGGFPWPRTYFAVILHVLKTWGVRGVIFDVMFSRPSTSPIHDESFRESIQKHGGVYFPVFSERIGGEDQWFEVLSYFQEASKGNGHVLLQPDPDGVFRRVTPFVTLEGVEKPYLGLRAAYELFGKTLPPASELPFPRDVSGRFILNWTDRWAKAFPHYSFINVLRSFQALEKNQTPLVDPSSLKDKICIIGHTALGGVDIKATPLENLTPGMSFIAQTIDNVLFDRFIRPAPPEVNLAVTVALGLAALLICLRFRPLGTSVQLFFLALAWVGAAYGFFLKASYWIAVVQPLVLIFALYIFSAVWSKFVADREQKRLFNLAIRDGLTGLYTRGFFEGVLSNSINEALDGRQLLILFMMDIDHFKLINDRYGHQAGDYVLRGVAQTIAASVRSVRPQGQMDYVGRYGGEEISVMLRGIHQIPAGAQAAERIRKNIAEKEFFFNDQKIPVTLSIGVSVLKETDDAASLIRRADECLYRAKAEGRNRVCLEAAFDPSPKNPGPPL